MSGHDFSARDMQCNTNSRKIRAPYTDMRRSARASQFFGDANPCSWSTCGHHRNSATYPHLDWREVSGCLQQGRREKSCSRPSFIYPLPWPCTATCLEHGSVPEEGQVRESHTRHILLGCMADDFLLGTRSRRIYSDLTFLARSMPFWDRPPWLLEPMNTTRWMIKPSLPLSAKTSLASPANLQRLILPNFMTRSFRNRIWNRSLRRR